MKTYLLFYVGSDADEDMASGGRDPDGHMEEEEASLEQSSGVLQFRQQREAEQEYGRSVDRQHGGHQSTPQDREYGGVNDDSPAMSRHVSYADLDGVQQRRNREQDGGDVFSLSPRRESAGSLANYQRGLHQQGSGEYRPRRALERPLMKPDRYDGTEDWDSYIHHFEWCAELNGWPDADKASFLLVALTGTARQVLARETRQRFVDYNSIVQVLQARFDPAGRTELHRIQLKTRVQKPGESLLMLADDIRRLVDKVYHNVPEEARGKMARDAFIDALTDREMRLRVLQMRTTTLQEALEAAIELEAMMLAEEARSLTSVRMIGSVGFQDPPPCAPQEFQQEMIRLLKELADTLSIGTARSEPRLCYKCGDPSHRVRNCPYKSKSKKPPKNDEGGN